jgi:hypothetical protein
VYSYFADLRNEPQWNHGHVRNDTKTSPGPIGLGTTLEGDHPGFGKATWRLREHDPPKHLVIEGKAGGPPYRYVGDLERDDGGKVLRGLVEWEPRGVLRALGPLLPAPPGMQGRRSFHNLRTATEAR